MSDKNTTSPKGIDFLEGLTILFVGLKLTGYIGWLWFWVLSPLIFSWVLAAVIVALAAIAIKLNNR